MLIKRCSRCGKFLGEDSFSWSNKKKKTKHSYCKRCQSQVYAFWKKDKIDYLKQYQYKYYTLNKKRILIRNKQYRINNIEKIKQYEKYRNSKEYRKRKKAMYNASYTARKLNQSPVLTELEKRKVEMYYRISKYLGEDWHVDHIIPLSKGGLHHPDNLQIITKHQNLIKSNKINSNIIGFRL